MITHTIDSYWIPGQNKTKPKLQIKKFAKTSFFLLMRNSVHFTHIMKVLDKMCKYEVNSVNIALSRTTDCNKSLLILGQRIPVKVTLDISGIPIDFQWGLGNI